MDYGPPLPDLTGPPPWKCPKCGSELLDLRGQGFDGDAVRREGRCFLFGANSFECVGTFSNRLSDAVPLTADALKAAVAVLREDTRRTRGSIPPERPIVSPQEWDAARARGWIDEDGALTAKYWADFGSLEADDLYRAFAAFET